MSNERVRVITEEQYKEYMKLKNHISQQEKKVRRWKPKDGDCVWVIYNDGSVEETIYLSNIDEHRLKAGFCFKTEEEAQKELDRRFAEQEILDFCDWTVGEPYQIGYYRSDDTFHPASFMGAYCPYRFASKESCQKAIDTLGTEKLKLIFRID